MKIKNKLTLFFTILIAFILILLNLYIYILSRNSTVDNFYNQLRDRAIITATVFLEADEQNSNIIREYEKKYLDKLPGEIIRVYDKNNKRVYADTAGIFNFEPSIIEQVRKKKEFRFEKDNRQVLGIYYQDNEGDFAIISSAYDESGHASLGRLKEILLFGFFSSIIVVIIAGRYFTRLMTHPISVISVRTNMISDTNLHLRLNEGNGKDELAHLSITINKMLKRLEQAFDLQRSFVSNASHELRTPLTSIIGNIEVTLSRPRTVNEYREVMESILNDAEKLHSLTTGLLTLAQSNVENSFLRLDEVRLDELLMEMKANMQMKLPECPVELNFPSLPENSTGVTVRCDRNLLETALMNILDNACKFSNGNKVVISMEPDEEFITVKISDIGIGIAENEIQHITETLYRAANARTYSGYGIGLALSEKIISAHGASLKIDSVLGKGTTVSIILKPIGRN